MKMISNNKQIQKGFSLIELVLTLIIISVMLTLAAPAFTNIYEDNAQAANANKFISSLTLARSEAVTRNINVVMCRLNSSDNGCATTGFWEDGWVIWADTDGDGVLEETNQNGDVEVIYSEEELENGYTIRALNNQFSNTISFSPIGEASGNAGSGQEIFRLCDPDNDNDKTRLIYLSGAGNAWVNRISGSNVAATNCT